MVDGDERKGWIDVLRGLPAAAATCLVLTGCRDKPSEESTNTDLSPSAGDGAFKGRRYENAFFGLTVTVPEDWFLPSADDFNRVMAAGAKLAGQTTAPAEADDGPGDARLFSILRHSPQSDGVSNPGLIAVAEYVGPEGENNTSRDYLKQLKNSLKEGPLDWTTDGLIAAEEIGGVSFSSMQGQLSDGSNFVDQAYYVTIRKEYAVCFVLSYTDEEQRGELKEILDTIVFVQPKGV